MAGGCPALASWFERALYLLPRYFGLSFVSWFRFAQIILPS